MSTQQDIKTGGWRKLYNSELYSINCLTAIIRTVMGKKARWAGHLARILYINAYNDLVCKPAIDYWQDLGIRERILLK
jgi:hypothetical protein